MSLTSSVYSTQDEGKGLARLTWQQIRSYVEKANPELCRLIDEVSPGNEFAFYLAYYPYGTLIGDDKTIFMPTMQGEFLPLNEAHHFPREVIDDLGYGALSAPFSMVLTNTAECFFDRPQYNLTLPFWLLSTGDLASTKRVLYDYDHERNSILHCVAGCRSAIMLPPISSTYHFNNIRRQFAISDHRPSQLYQHGELFAALAKDPNAGCTWQMSFVYFCRRFVQAAKTDPAWQKILIYIYRYAMKNLYLKGVSDVYMSMTLTEAQKKRNIKLDPYLSDTVYHLYKIAAGLAPGFTPAVDETYLPLEFLQRIFIDVYGLTKYYPTILHPAYFNINEINALPVYYANQYPTTFAASPRTRNIATVTHKLSELQRLLDQLRIGLKQLTPDHNNKVWIDIGDKIDFITYHNYNGSQKNIQFSHTLATVDPRFAAAGCALPLSDRILCDDGAFVRGCVAIRLKK